MPGYPRPASVRACPLGELAEVLGAEVPAAAGPPDPTAAVTGVTHASDQVRPGDLFAALPGSRTHGAFTPRRTRSAMRSR